MTETDTPVLTTPRIHVVLEDGRAYDVQVRNKDLVMWDRERAKRSWPEASAAPFMWLTFLAWRCLLREGAVPETLGLQAFEDITLEVTSLGNEDVNPTQAGATPE